MKHPNKCSLCYYQTCDANQTRLASAVKNSIDVYKLIKVKFDAAANVIESAPMTPTVKECGESLVLLQSATTYFTLSLFWVAYLVSCQSINPIYVSLIDFAFILIYINCVIIPLQFFIKLG